MSTTTMAAMPQEAIQQGSTQPETTKPDKYSISTAEALREGYSVPEPVPETVSCKYCGRKLEYYGLVSPVAPRHVIIWKSRPELVQRMTPESGDSRNAEKTLDRLKETCVGIDMTWESWRAR